MWLTSKTYKQVNLVNNICFINYYFSVFFEAPRNSSTLVNSSVNTTTQRTGETKQRYETDLNSLEISGVVIYRGELADNVLTKLI